jgi:starvation-inducible DNA-binding protein
LGARERRILDAAVSAARLIATASLLEVWVDEAERRTWVLFESSRSGTPRH